jgi:hypothetical protein
MRARQMLSKLDKVAIDPHRPVTWDISLLSAEQQDRLRELLAAKIGDVDDPNWKPVITRDELRCRELEELTADLPMIGEDEGFSRELPGVHRSLQRYWQGRQSARTYRRYDFWSLKAVEKLRINELCAKYGWQEGCLPHQTMLALSKWPEDDQQEMRGLLDKAASLYEERH